ncbi:MAG: hypothetical protein EXR88_03570 [Gammaproteobacteria bacterium]|nr:hypothetical protein [Gammaproteobacteria bacterium]
MNDLFEEHILKIKEVELKGGKVDWSAFKKHSAWFDLDSAYDEIDRRILSNEISFEQSEFLKEWVDNGGVHIKGAIDENDIDEVNTFVDNLLTTNTPNENVTFLGYTLDKAKGGDSVAHKDLISLSLEGRMKNSKISPWRIHELWAESNGAKNIYQNEKLKEITTLIFGKKSYPRSTINFYYGSQQELHQDMSVFHVFPGDYLIGAWIALEDISIDSGPLVYAPGSHKSDIYEGFLNHPQTNLRTCPLDEYAGYYNKMHARSNNQRLW